MIIILCLALGIVMFAGGWIIGYKAGERNFRRVLKEKGLL